MRRSLCAVAIATGLLAGGMVCAKAETISVTTWGAAFYGAPYAVAMKKGFFKAHGIDITNVLSSLGGGTTVRNTLAGDTPIGEVALSAAVLAINNGEQILLVGGGAQSVADELWLTKASSPFHSIHDLKGQKVGITSVGSISNMLLLMCLQKSGMSPNDITMIPVGGIGANLSAAMNGALAAAMSAEPTWTTEAEGKARPVFWVKDVISPKMMTTVVITTPEYAKAHPDKLRALLAGRADGVAYIKAHPDESADIIAAAYHADPAIYRKIIRHFVDLDYWSPGRFDYPAMNRIVEGLQIIGKQKGPVDWSKIVDTSFLSPDLAKPIQ